MKRYLMIIKDSLKSVFSMPKLCFIIFVFIYTFVSKIDNIKDINNLSKVMENAFYGPINLTDNIVEVLAWSLYQFFLIYIIGSYCFKELDKRSIYTITRVGNKQSWHLCLQTTCFLACVIYFLLGAFIMILCTFIVNRCININNISEMFKLIGILSISSYYIVTVYILGVLISKKHNQSFLALIALLYFFIAFGDITKLDKYIPFNQGIIAKHIINNFGYNLSFALLAVFILLNLFIINIVVVKRDLLQITR